MSKECDTLRTPRLGLVVGDLVLVVGHLDEGPRIVVKVLDQTRWVGGVKLDRCVDDFFVHWNEDELVRAP